MKTNRTIKTVLAGTILGISLAGAAAGATGVKPEEPSRVEVSQARESAIEYLMEVAVSGGAQGRANALEGLAQAPSRVKRVLPASLVDDNQGVRTVAAMVAGRLRVKQAKASLEGMLRDSSPFARAAAVYGLRQFGQKNDPSMLAGLLLDHPEPRVRAHAAFILGELGDKSALPLLRQAAVQPMARAGGVAKRLLRLQIAEAMIKLGDGEQIDVIRAALYPSRPEELEATAVAVQIIGELRDRGSIDQLIGLTYGAKETERAMPAEVRMAAAEALAKMGQLNGRSIALEYAGDGNPAIRAQAASLLGWSGGRADLPTLQRLLGDGTELVRVSAASAIVRLATR